MALTKVEFLVRRWELESVRTTCHKGHRATNIREQMPVKPRGKQQKHTKPSLQESHCKRHMQPICRWRWFILFSTIETKVCTQHETLSGDLRLSIWIEYERFAENLFSFRVFPLFFKQLSQMNLVRETERNNTPVNIHTDNMRVQLCQAIKSKS